MKEGGEGLESALDGLLTGIDQLLAQRPDGPAMAALTQPPPRPPSEDLRTEVARPTTDPALHVVTALLHQPGLSAGLREAAVSLIRRLVLARAVPPPDGLPWRGEPSLSPRLLPWLTHLQGLKGLQAWAGEEGEWIYLAQSCAQIPDRLLRDDPVAWRADICAGFPVAGLAEVSQAPHRTNAQDPYQILRMPRFPEFCRLSVQGQSCVVDPQGAPAMVRWLDAFQPESPDLLGLAWPLSETLDEHLRLPVPVIGIPADFR